MTDNKDIIEYSEPLMKALINQFTFGFGGAIIETAQIPYNKRRSKNINDFMQQTIKKVKQLDLEIEEIDIRKHINSDEFMQIFTKIINQIQFEKRDKIKKAYSNLLIQLIKEDPKINFNKKMFYLNILETLTEDHIKILFIFYKLGNIKERYPLDHLKKKLDCYVKRKLRKDDPKPIESFFGGKDPEFITSLDPLKASYFEGLIEDLVGKRIISKTQEIKVTPNYDRKSEEDDEDKEEKLSDMTTESFEEYVGTELGRDFYKYILK